MSLDIHCTNHDWGALNTELIFIFDRALRNTGVDGYQDRNFELSAWLVRHGKATLRVGNQSTEAHEGQWLISTGKRIHQQFSPDTHLLSIRLHHDWPDGSHLLEGGPTSVFDAQDHPLLEALANRLLEEVGEIDWLSSRPSFAFLYQKHINFNAYLRQRLLLLDWLQVLVPVVSRDPKWRLNIPAGIDSRLAKALLVMEESDPAEPFPQQELTLAGGLSFSQLNRLCKATYDKTLYGYWDHLRLQHAQVALTQERASIKTVASGLGFTQLSHFSAWFKRHTGASPRAYIKQSPDQI